MEQAPSLTMNPTSVPPSPKPPTLAPEPTSSLSASQSGSSSASTVQGDTADESKQSERDTTNEQPQTQTQTAAERAFQHGLNRGNLETEVTQVMGTLNNWWGGVKKQSTSTFWTIKADMDRAVQQAQAEMEHLRTTNVEIIRKDTHADDAEEKKEQEQDVKGKGKERAEGDTPVASTGTGAGSAAFPASATEFFTRLTSSTNQIQHTLQSATSQLQNTLQSTLASAQANPALSNPSQIRAQLVENLRSVSNKENIQLSLKQAEKLAEEYLKKGDQWVKDAEKWVGDNIKVVAPEEAERRAAGMSWDGSDFYSFSTSSPVPKKEKEEVIFDAGASGGRTPRQSMAGVTLAGSRKEALLRRLREDKDLLLVDPEAEGETQQRRDEFRNWVKDKWEKTAKEEREKEEGNVGEIRMALVPEHISDEQFWQRYLFHKSMIEAEEERRKAVLAASQQAVQDDFSWDDEPESSPPPTTTHAQTLTQPAPIPSESLTPKAADTEKFAPAPALAPAIAPSSKPDVTTTSTSTSPRDSEESYDVVQKQSAVPTDDDDSDWE